MEQEKEHHGISPAILGIIALLSVGGLIFIGWQANLTGKAISGPYFACCSVQPWGSSASGYRQGTTAVNTELCDPSELPNRCCVRAGRERYDAPVNLIGSSSGACSPSIAYPAYPVGYQACCTVQSCQRTPTGYSQGTAQTMSQSCNPSETLFECCSRAGVSRLNLPVRVLGFKQGSCSSPEKAYPLGQGPVRTYGAASTYAYAACCSFETWRQSPTGYTQGEAQTATGYCEPSETPSQCCRRAGALATPYPIKLLSYRMGSCEPSVPEASYPVWVR
ncbi:hypothetical protein KY309_01090 [Candidatus Woesearchaeota archaeon]|nr:hypothetical protein [Candidatus Woesearchaeota archaeon]